MRAFAFSLLLLVSGAARAEWRTLSVAGTPTDVEVWRPGVFSVSTTSQAVLLENGVVTQSVTGESLGTLLAPSGCLLSLRRDGSFVAGTFTATGAACPHPADSPFGTSGLNAVAYARTAGGAAFAYGELAADQRLVYTPSAADAGSWTALPNPAARKATRLVDAVRVGATDHALFGVVGGLGTELLWYAGPAAPQTVSLGAGVGLLEAELFALEGAGPAALLGAASGLYRGVLGSGAAPFEQLPLPAGVVGVAGVDVTPDAGSALADGFGLGVGQLADGGRAVLNALPTGTPAEVGRSWQLNTRFPGSGLPADFNAAALERVRCLGAAFCAFTVRSSAANNVLVYANAAAPSFGTLAPVELDEGQQVTVSLPATDLDGDALRLGAALADGGSVAVGLSVEAAAGGLRLVLSAGNVCAPAGAEVVLFAADGLAAHDTSVRLPVSVRNSLPDPRVELGSVDSTALSVRCGEGARGRLVQPLPAGLCADVAVEWSQLSGPSLQQPRLSGAAVQVQTVETELDALLGETLVLQVTADAGAGNVDTRAQPLLLSAEPFVSLQRRTERPLAVEGETVGVFTELHNPTACALQDVRVEEQLQGLDYVPGSARYDGAAVQAEAQEGRLVVRGLPLGARARGTLSYQVRTRLLGAGTGITGEAFRRSVRISRALEESQTPGGCGCSGGPAATGGVALLAVAHWLRRRRSPGFKREWPAHARRCG